MCGTGRAGRHDPMRTGKDLFTDENTVATVDETRVLAGYDKASRAGYAADHG